MTNGWGPVEKDRSNGDAAAGDGATLTSNGITYAKGLGVHAASDVRYALGATCTRFKAVGRRRRRGRRATARSSSRCTRARPRSTTRAHDRLDRDQARSTSPSPARASCGSSSRTAATASTATTPTGRSRASSAAAAAATRRRPRSRARRRRRGDAGSRSTSRPTATFSEAMNPATLTTTTFTLVKQGTTTPLAASVSYASQTATLDPSAEPASRARPTRRRSRAAPREPRTSPATRSPPTSAGASRRQPARTSRRRPSSTRPRSTLTWKVGDTISFSGHATDPEQGTLPASALSWTLVIQHCPSNCHTHTIQTWTGVASGSFTAPDHEYPVLPRARADGDGRAAARARRRRVGSIRRRSSSPSPRRPPACSSPSTAASSGDAVHAHGDRRLDELAQRDLAADAGRDDATSSHRGRTAARRRTTSSRPRPPTTYTATYTAGHRRAGSTYLSDLTWTSTTNGWGPVEKDQSNGEAAAGDGTTLTLNGTTYAKGLGMHAASDVRYAISADCTRFKAEVGVDDEVGANGSVVFEVYAGATKVYDSGVMTGSTATQPIDVSIAGASELRLVVTATPATASTPTTPTGRLRASSAAAAAATRPRPRSPARTPAAGATGVATQRLARPPPSPRR